MIRFCVLLCGLLLGAAGGALAQSGSLSGRVLSRESRAPLEAARVEASLSGSGDGEVTATEALDAALSGSGDLTVVLRRR